MDIKDNAKPTFTRQEILDQGYEIDDDGEVYDPNDVVILTDEDEDGRGEGGIDAA